jgi:hypothetical protein
MHEILFFPKSGFPAIVKYRPRLKRGVSHNQVVSSTNAVSAAGAKQAAVLDPLFYHLATTSNKSASFSDTGLSHLAGFWDHFRLKLSPGRGVNESFVDSSLRIIVMPILEGGQWSVAVLSGFKSTNTLKNSLLPPNSGASSGPFVVYFNPSLSAEGGAATAQASSCRALLAAVLSACKHATVSPSQLPLVTVKLMSSTISLLKTTSSATVAAADSGALVLLFLRKHFVSLVSGDGDFAERPKTVAFTTPKGHVESAAQVYTDLHNRYSKRAADTAASKAAFLEYMTAHKFGPLKVTGG